MPRSVLIISTGRTGTKFLANYINKYYPDVAAYHASRFTPLINILCNAYLEGFLPRSVLKIVWNLLKKNEVLNCKKKLYLDSNNHLYAIPTIAPGLYPNLKVIHIIRDPRDYVTSHINWIKHRQKSYIAQYFIPFWQPNGFLLHKISFLKWKNMSLFERFCWIWEYKNHLIATTSHKGYEYCSFRFEDIFRSPDGTATLNKLLQFSGLEPISTDGNEAKKPTNAAKGKSFPGWHNWEPEMCAQMDAICGNQMRSYGYGIEDTWREKVSLGKHKNI